jgi:hypothetical protein
MNDYIMLYSSENNIYKMNDELKINKLDIQQIQLDEKFFDYKISLFFIEKDLILKENENDIIFKDNYKYIYLQNRFPYKRVVVDYIYNFDIYVNLISIEPLNNIVLAYIKKKILELTKKINSIQFKKIDKIENIIMNKFDINNLYFIITSNTFNIKENETIMESIYKKISVTPRKIKVLYRGIQDVEMLHHEQEKKYTSTSVNPSVSSMFTGNTCCFQILYNLNVPYIILNDSEEEYVLQKNYYYHKIHVNYIRILKNTYKLKCIHYIISLHKLSSSELKEIKKKIDIDQSLLKLYEQYISNYKKIKYPINYSKVLHSKDNTYPDGYLLWSSEFYKKKYKSLTSKEVNVIVYWKSSPIYINSYSYMNISLFYTIMYDLCHTPPIHKKTEIVGFHSKYVSYEKEKIIPNRRKNNTYKKYYLVILEETNNKNKIIIHPELIIKKYNNFTFIYHPGSILKHDSSEDNDEYKYEDNYDNNSNTIQLYPNNVEVKKNEIYYGNMKGIFDDYTINS